MIENIRNEFIQISKNYEERTSYNYWEEHVKYVVDFALELAEKVDADKEIVEIGAILHDIAKVLVEEREPHNIIGADLAGEMFRVTSHDLDKISRNPYNVSLDSEDFFGKRVNLTVSGQLEAEAMACSLGKVYTFGPSFRAENSNTKRHAAEFWLFEPEIAFADLEEAMIVANDLVKYVFKRVLVDCSEEINFFTKFYDEGLFDRLINVIENDFVTLDYSETVRILQNSDVDFEFPVYWGCDLKK